MADAPSGGGGLSAGEIILLAVLGLGVIATLTGHPLTDTSSTGTVSTTTPATHCGITLTRPKSKENITNVVTVVGSITPCGHDPLTDQVTVQVVDSTGAPMSAYTPVPIAASDNSKGSFTANIPITGSPAAGTGYVIVTGPNSTTGTTPTARTAIKFVGYSGSIIYTSGSAASTNPNGSYFVPSPNAATQQSQYVAPTPTQQTNNPSTGGGTTF